MSTKPCSNQWEWTNEQSVCGMKTFWLYTKFIMLEFDESLGVLHLVFRPSRSLRFRVTNGDCGVLVTNASRDCVPHIHVVVLGETGEMLLQGGATKKQRDNEKRSP